MADQLVFNPLRALDRNGDPVASAKAYVYESGTTTPVTVETANGVPLAWPVLADANGIFPQMCGDGPLRVVVTDAANAVLPGFPLDDVPLVPLADESLGVDQTYAVPVRVAGDIYQNTTGRPIFVAIAGTAANVAVQVSSNGSSFITVGRVQTGGSNVSFIVPPDWYYRAGAGVTVTQWAEMS